MRVMKNTFSAAVLAGGECRRMGRVNKALLEVDGVPILEGSIEKLRTLFSNIMIVGNDVESYESFGAPVFPDRRPGQGALGGLYTALVEATTPGVFCVACDMPFLHPGVVSLLLERASEGWEIAIPRLDEGLEPLCAVYTASLTPKIERLMDRGERRIRHLLDGARVCYVEEDELRKIDEDLLTFVNINTPMDLERAQAITTW